MRGILPGLLLFAASFACVVDDEAPCTSAGDCGTDSRCQGGVCRAGVIPADDPRDVDCTDRGDRVSLRFSLDVLDLDTGDVHDTQFGVPSGWDLLAVDNGRPPGLLFHNTSESGQIAYTDVPFCAVDEDHANALPLSTSFRDIPLRDTVVMKTSRGRLFAVGDGANPETGVLALSFVEVSP